MKKVLMVLTLFFGVFFLGACDFGGEEIGIRDAWYDQENEMLQISYNIPETKVAEGEELPIEVLTLEGKHVDADEWFTIDELDQFDADQLQIQYRFEDYGDIEIRVVLRDDAGNIITETDSYIIYINQPQYIYHFNAHFDSWSGAVRFDWGVNENVVHKLVFEKSVDGGLTWEEVMMLELEVSEEGFMKNEISYYEYEEGNYVYRTTAYGEANEELHTLTSWGEINVWFDEHQYEGEGQINYVNAWVDTYSLQVNLWWDSYGDFDTVYIEKSTDLVSFEFLDELPRFAQSYNYQEEVDGYYYYRVTAIKDGVSISEYTMFDPIRVKEDAVIGTVDGWLDHDTGVVNLNWSVRQEEVKGILVERRLADSTEYVLLGEFGNLKSTHEDKDLAPGVYVYKISATDELGTVIDFIETKEFEIFPPVLVYNLNASFDYYSGVVHFWFSVDTEDVHEIMIEKSEDGGMTWTEVVFEELVEEDGWVKQEANYSEFGEGEFKYRITGYDTMGNNVGTVEAWDQVTISFEHLNLQEPSEIFYLEANSDIYNASVNLWWDAQGMFERYVLYKSTDQMAWIKVVELPRFSTSFYYEEELDGNYYYKIEAKDSDGVTIHEIETQYTVRVKNDAVLGQINIWHDWWSGEIEVSWEMFNEENMKVVLERKNIEDDAYEVIGEFDGFTKQFRDEIFETGTYQYRVTVFDEFDNQLDQLESYEAYFEAPNQIYHFNVYFNYGANDIRINFGVNEYKVHSYIIEKSPDGGLTWEEVFNQNLEYLDEYYVANLNYYEFEEGQFVYRMKVFNEEGFEVGTLESCCEVVVQFDNMNLEGDVEIFSHNAHYNIWSQEVQLWWHSQGDYFGHKIEKSLDGITWEEIETIPRFSTGYTYYEMIDGMYTYRVSAVLEDGTVLHSLESHNVVRVKQDALIGNFNAYLDWTGEVELYWDVIDEDVALIQVNRRLVDGTEYTLIGEYGHLKRVVFDELTVDGSYVYMLTLLDADGNVLDELETDSVHYTAPID